MGNLRQKQNMGKTVAALLLAVLVLGVFLFSNLYISEHLAHDCSGEDCPICAQIQNAESLIHQIGCGLLAVFAAFGVICAYAVLFPAFCSFIPRKTLISNKVRLND